MARAKDFSFIGRLCLDFAQTGDMGWGARYERLTSPSELGRWLTLCPLHVAVASVTAADLVRATGLRTAIWRTAQALLAGDKPLAIRVRSHDDAWCIRCTNAVPHSMRNAGRVYAPTCVPARDRALIEGAKACGNVRRIPT